MVNSDSPPLPTADGHANVGLGTLAKDFLWLGTISFGGPAAHIALMEEMVVHRRRWVTGNEFLDLISATNLIPGPNSTEMAIHIGHRVAGTKGLMVAGMCFILPAVLIVSAAAAFYTSYGQLPAVMGVLYGVKPVIIAIIAQAVWRLGRTSLTSWHMGVAVVISVVLIVAGVHEIAALFGVGIGMGVIRNFTSRINRGSVASLAMIGASAVPEAIVGTATAFGLWPLFVFFLKVGAVLFGSGYVLLAFLRADLVERYGWLTEPQLLDAIAIGQVTPGPVFTTATFIGYILGGPSGAVVATIGIFLPAFIYVAASIPILPRLRRSRFASAFLDGVNAASLALMVVVTWHLAKSAVIDVPTIILAVASGSALLFTKVNSTWLVALGAGAGLALTATG